MEVPHVCNLYLQSSVKKGKGKEGTVTLQGSELIAQACTLPGGNCTGDQLSSGLQVTTSALCHIRPPGGGLQHRGFVADFGG